MHAVAPNGNKTRPVPDAAARLPALQSLRDRCLKLGAELPWAERGAILTLLGSAERAYYLIERIDAERKSVARVLPAAATQPRESGLPLGGGAAVPA
jgi:phosphate:Na+ symporter